MSDLSWRALLTGARRLWRLEGSPPVVAACNAVDDVDGVELRSEESDVEERQHDRPRLSPVVGAS